MCGTARTKEMIELKQMEWEEKRKRTKAEEKALRAEKQKKGEELLKAVRSLHLLVDAERREACRMREIVSGTRAVFCPRRKSAAERESERNQAEERLLELERRWTEDAQRLAEKERAIGAALSKLPAEDCLLLQLHWLRGLTWEAVGMRLYFSERTARRRGAAALAALWEAYGKENEGKENEGKETGSLAS